MQRRGVQTMFKMFALITAFGIAMAQDVKAPLKELVSSKELKEVEAKGRMQMKEIEGSPALRAQQREFNQMLQQLEQDASLAARKHKMQQELRTIEASPERLHAIEKQRLEIEAAKK